jgi:ubiquinone/menaquinone biosynthesis C-methylase UbiE
MRESKRLTTREGYATWARSYDDEQNPLIMTEEPRVKELLAGIPHPSSALDVATGTGRWALYLAKRGVSVVGIDESPEMLQVAQDKAHAAGLSISFLEGTLEDGLPFPSGQFDLVVCALALCHVHDIRAAVSSCSRVLRSGGHLLITDFHPQAVLNGWETALVADGETFILPNARHSRSDYLDAVRESGCELVHLEEILVREQPQEAVMHGPQDVEAFMREYGDWPFCLIILARLKFSTLSKRRAGEDDITVLYDEYPSGIDGPSLDITNDSAVTGRSPAHR